MTEGGRGAVRCDEIKAGSTYVGKTGGRRYVISRTKPFPACMPSCDDIIYDVPEGGVMQCMASTFARWAEHEARPGVEEGAGAVSEGMRDVLAKWRESTMFSSAVHGADEIIAALAAAGYAIVPARCLVTGNVFGTDTWMIGRPCECAVCQAMLAAAPKPERAR